MQITILGTATGIPLKNRSHPGIFIKIKNKNILFDSGAGTLRSLAKINIHYPALDYLFYTHFHPDHSLDFISILFACRNTLPPRKKTLEVFGPKRLKKFYQNCLRLYKGCLEPKNYKLNLREIENFKGDFEDFSLESCLLKHVEKNLGFRLKEKNGKSVVYSGDTDYCKELINLAKDCNLLILECSFPDEMKVRGHLTPSECGKIAQEAKAKRLMLTHFYPVFKNYDILKRVKKYYSGPIELTKDRLKISL